MSNRIQQQSLLVHVYQIFPSLSRSWCYPSAIPAFSKLGIKEVWTVYLFLHHADYFNYLIESSSYKKSREDE